MSVSFQLESKNLDQKYNRTLLQVEPVLGGKKLDLLRIYKTVIDAGGYEKVIFIRMIMSQTNILFR
jgi:hypothetical protein